MQNYHCMLCSTNTQQEMISIKNIIQFSQAETRVEHNNKNIYHGLSTIHKGYCWKDSKELWSIQYQECYLKAIQPFGYISPETQPFRRKLPITCILCHYAKKYKREISLFLSKGGGTSKNCCPKRDTIYGEKKMVINLCETKSTLEDKLT